MIIFFSMSSSPKLYSSGYLVLNASNFFYSLYAVTFIFIPAYLYQLGMREGEIGLLMATGTLVAASLKPLNASIVGRGQRKRFLILGALLAALSTFPWIFISAPGPFLYLLRMLQGASFSLFSMASLSYIAASAPSQRRAEAFGIFGLNFFLPASVGGLIGEWVIMRADYQGLFLGGICMVLVAAFLPIFMREPAVREEQATLHSLSVFLTKPFLAPNTAGLLFGITHGTIFSFLPVYLFSTGKTSLGIFVFVHAMSVIITRLAGRRIIDRHPKEKTALAALFLLCVGTLLIPLAETNFMLSVGGAAVGTGYGLLFPAMSALVLDRSGNRSGGMAIAMFSSAFDVGTVAGAAVFGFVAQGFGFPTMFFVASAILGAGTFGFFLMDPSFRKGARPSPG